MLCKVVELDGSSNNDKLLESTRYVTVTLAASFQGQQTKLTPRALPLTFLINLPKFISVFTKMRFSFATAAVLALGAQSVAASTWFSKAGKSRMFAVDSWLPIESFIGCLSEHP